MMAETAAQAAQRKSKEEAAKKKAKAAGPSRQAKMLEDKDAPWRTAGSTGPPLGAAATPSKPPVPPSTSKDLPADRPKGGGPPLRTQFKPGLVGDIQFQKATEAYQVREK